MDDIDSQAPQALRDASLRSRHAAVRSASCVLLSGLLESFLRNCAESFFDDLNRKGVRFSEIPEKMRDIHYVAGSEWIQKLVREDKKAKAGFTTTRVGLARLTKPEATASSLLIWEAFAATKGNPGPDVIADYLRNFGVENPLAKVASVGGPSETFVKTKLQNFIVLRNECAHTGSNNTVPQPSEVREYVLFLRQLTLAISKVLKARLGEMVASALAGRVAAAP